MFNIYLINYSITTIFFFFGFKLYLLYKENLKIILTQIETLESQNDTIVLLKKSNEHLYVLLENKVNLNFSYVVDNVSSTFTAHTILVIFIACGLCMTYYYLPFLFSAKQASNILTSDLSGNLEYLKMIQAHIILGSENRSLIFYNAVKLKTDIFITKSIILLNRMGDLGRENANFPHNVQALANLNADLQAQLIFLLGEGCLI